jgi:hypothetical protein
MRTLPIALLLVLSCSNDASPPPADDEDDDSSAEPASTKDGGAERDASPLRPDAAMDHRKDAATDARRDGSADASRGATVRDGESDPEDVLSSSDGATATPTESDASDPSKRDGGAPNTNRADGASPSAGCAGAALCSGFEESMSLPSGWVTAADDCMGDGKVAIDDTVALGGDRSLRISSSGGYCNHIFAAPMLSPSQLGDELWVRFHLRLESAPGSEHVTFLTIEDGVSGKDLRMGFQSGIYMWNREKDDATLPELSPAGVALSRMPKVGAFECIELRLHGAAGQLETFIDGAAIAGLTVDDMATHDVDGQWLRPGPFRAQPKNLRIGWESYGGKPMTLWVDDVAVGSTRIGCK